MSVDLYEQYKDALRHGHMAIAAGDLEAALAAYRAAIALAPERASPHAGLGGALFRTGAFVDALASFDAALTRSPRHAEGLRGRAETLHALGRQTDAAETLDVLSATLEQAGRLGEACDATRRALDLAEQKARRRRFQELTRRLRLQAGDQVAEVLPALPTANRAMEPETGGPAMAALPLTAAVEPSAAMGAAREPAGPTADAPARSLPMAAAAIVPAAVQAAVVGPPPDPLTSVARAEAAFDAGDLVTAREAYLAAAAVFEANGLHTAALDTCYSVLAFAPDDPDVHLRLVELYLELGWNAPVADKLALLGRLARLDGRSDATLARIVELAADHFPDDSRLWNLVAPGANPR